MAPGPPIKPRQNTRQRLPRRNLEPSATLDYSKRWPPPSDPPTLFRSAGSSAGYVRLHPGREGVAAAPAVLDLFMWLSYRCFTAKEEERMPLFGEFELTAQLGSVEYSRPRRFRAMLEQWLGQIRTVWPECPAQICSDGRSLRISPARAVLAEAQVRW